MDGKQRNLLLNLNRLFIFALTLTGLLMAGLQASDLPVTLALMAWLWLALWTRMEARLLNWVSGSLAAPSIAEAPNSPQKSSAAKM